MKFSRGYNEVREKLKNSPAFLMSCFNCAFYFSEDGEEKEECCQNKEVLKYDMIVNGHSVYCHFWKPSHIKKLPHKKTGRDRL